MLFVSRDCFIRLAETTALKARSSVVGTLYYDLAGKIVILTFFLDHYRYCFCFVARYNLAAGLKIVKRLCQARVFVLEQIRGGERALHELLNIFASLIVAIVNHKNREERITATI